jgi:aryl-alcohol dehydrogenase-like predicted oxidoreductase
MALGCEPLGGTDWGQVDLALARQAVGRALELGINLFDTADIYGLGQSEIRLAQTLGAKRHDVIIMSKFGVNWMLGQTGERARTFVDASPRHVVAAVENSLRRLNMDCIPIYFIHWPDPATPLTDTVDALQRCQAAGKIRYLGLSNFSASQIREAYQLIPITVVQIQYNLLNWQTAQGLLDVCDELGINVLAYGTLAQGLLTGKYGRASRFDSNDRRHRLPHFQADALEINLRLVERIRTMSEQHRHSPTQIAIRWVLDTSSIASVIVGAKTPTQIEENVEVMSFKLNETQRKWLSDSSS